MAKANTPSVNHDNTSTASIINSRGSNCTPPKDDVTLADALCNRASEPTPTTTTDNEFLCTVQNEYREDDLFSIIIDKPGEHRDFTLCDNLI